MSLETQSAVMRAGNNEAALKALALSGNMDAIAALKKLLDAKSSRDAAARQAGLQQPETPPVLEQVVGQLGQQEYAAGGRVRAFAGGDGSYVDPSGLDWKEGEGPFSRGGRRLVDFLRSLQTQDITQPLGGAKSDTSAPTVAPMAAPNPTTRMQRNGSAVSAPAPAPAAPRANVGIAPNMEQDTVERKSGPELRSAVPAPAAAPEAKDLTDAELTKQLDALTPLQKERDALRKKSREQLEAAYNAKVKNLTPSTYDRFMDFMAGVSAKGGSSAAQALGAGALNMHAKDKGRKTEMASVKEMYDKADLLEQQAALADKFGDVEKADKLRKEAAVLQKQIAAQKSTEKLQGSQADYYDAQADFVRNDKARIAEITAQAAKDRANRVGGGGLKQLSEKDANNWINTRADKIQKADAAAAKADMTNIDRKPITPAAAIEQAKRELAQMQAERAKGGSGLGAAAGVSPAAPKSYDFGALMQGS